jgi:hypothetical protein
LGVVDVGVRRVGVSRSKKAVEVVEFGKAVSASEEEPGVDRSGDGGARAHDGSDGDVEDVGDVSDAERALWLLDHDDGVVRVSSGRQRGEGEVAGPTQHGEP